MTAKQRGRGTIVPKGPGKFLVRAFVGRDVAGKRQYKSQQVQGSEKDARRALTALLSQIDARTVQATTKETVGAFVARFLTECKEGQIAAVTLRGYRDNLRLHIEPGLGGTRLDRLSAPAIQTWVTQLRTEKGLAPATIRHAYITLH